MQKDFIFDFTKANEDQYNEIKSAISENVVLKFFDPNLDTKITCDASKNGLGATLEQRHENIWYPVVFASRTMTISEVNYCQLEKETLSIVFACSKFHDYIYGKK